jgi:hypothetical protein
MWGAIEMMADDGAELRLSLSAGDVIMVGMYEAPRGD